MGLVHITSWYPNFNGSHFGLPPSEIHRMTGLPPKIVWTMTYSHRPHAVRLLREYSNHARPKSVADLSENGTEIRFAKPPYYNPSSLYELADRLPVSAGNFGRALQRHFSVDFPNHDVIGKIFCCSKRVCFAFVNRTRNGRTAFARSLPTHLFRDWSKTEAALKFNRLPGYPK